MGTVHEDPCLRNRTEVFRDREDAGEQLAHFLHEQFDLTRPVICPIPAGGVPIGVMIALALEAPLRPAVVRKIQVPWSTESGFGAVTWSGEVVINEDLLRRLQLSPQEVEYAISRAKASVEERIRTYGGRRPSPAIQGSTAILTDDGLASGFTMRAAIESIRLQDPGRVVVAVPTGSSSAVHMVSELADVLICLNIRGGFSFAVADAYSYWHDLTDKEVWAYLARAMQAGLY